MNCKEKEANVRNVQHALRVLNKNGEAVPEIYEDGIFGTETGSAVSAFQKNAGLSPNGEVDAATWKNLMEESGKMERKTALPLPIMPFQSERVSTVRVGESGEAVWFAQTMFHIIAHRFSGFDDVPIDGKNDGATTKALCCVQNASHCSCKDGTLDRDTWDELARLFSFCE